MAEKAHICTRMVDFIKSKGISVAVAEEMIGISGGYLRRSAKDNINVGLELVENFLAKFPDVDAYWLVTGESLGVKNGKKHTGATNIEEEFIDVVRRLNKCRDAYDEKVIEYDRKVKEVEDLKKNASIPTTEPELKK